MHEAVFEAGWETSELMSQHRAVVAAQHRGRGREVIDLDWTFAHHPGSEKIFGAKAAYDYVNGCWSCYQTVVTATIANRNRVDGIAVEVQQPNYAQEELAYLEMTVREEYENMEQVKQRLLELLHYYSNSQNY